MSEKATTGDQVVQMFYPPDGGGAAEMNLAGVGHFKKGTLFGQHKKDGKLVGHEVPLTVAQGIVDRKKGPRIATPEDIAWVNEQRAASAGSDTKEEPAIETPAAAGSDNKESAPGEPTTAETKEETTSVRRGKSQRIAVG